METDVTQVEMENHLRAKRQALALSQKQLADLAGITRQAVSALEANHYSPATSVALQLARAIHCRVEDLFSLKSGGEIVEGELLGAVPEGSGPWRAQVNQIGHRLLVRPLDGLGELVSLSATADGLIIESNPNTSRVKVKLLKDRQAVRRKIVVGGCDPAMFLAGEHVKKHDQENLVPCLMGSGIALNALRRGEVHVAGIHLAEETSRGWELPRPKAQPRRHGLPRRHFRPLGRGLYRPPGQSQEDPRGRRYRETERQHRQSRERLRRAAPSRQTNARECDQSQAGQRL